MNSRLAIRLGEDDAANIEVIAKAVMEARTVRGEAWSPVTITEALRTALTHSAAAAREGKLRVA